MSGWNSCEQLGAHHPLEGFSCGESSIDDWCKSGRQSHAARLCRIWVSADDTGSIAGFYTLSNHTVSGIELPGKDGGATGQVPATLLGKLALRRNLRGSGYGSLLLLDAMQRAVVGSDYSSSRLIVLDAANENVMKWYRKNSFKSFSELSPLRMYMKMSTAERIVKSQISKPDVAQLSPVL